MRACRVRQFGGPEVFEVADLPDPEPGPGQVLVRVAATSVNPLDYKIRSGVAGPLAPDLPAVLHGDVSGTVEAVGPQAPGRDPGTLRVGDAVYGCVGGVRGTPGTLADLVAADARLLAKAPTSIDLSRAAALPLVALTAWEGLDKASVRAGQQVLVHGGTGGVGHLAQQLARARGARVTVTASAAKLELARSLGAHAAVDYRAESVSEYVDRLTAGAGFDVVYDTIGADNIPRSVDAARLNGAVVTCQARSEQDLGILHRRGLSLHVVFMLIPLLYDVERERHGRILTELAALVDAGDVRPLIDEQVFSFEQVGEAHRRAASGDAAGKVLLVHGG